MRISESDIARIAAAADIVQVISGYVDLKKAGKDYRGICPFHGDKDPSLYVSPHKGIFYCFGCATGGSVFNFLMKIEGIPFAEAVRVLAARYGIELTIDEHWRESKDQKDRLLRCLGLAHQRFRENLRASREAREYVDRRDIPSEWIERLELGYAPDSWDDMSRHLTRAGIDPKDAVSCGLLKARQSEGFYDAFRSRLMIPIRDLNGNLVAFGGRILGEGEPKYLNSSESTVFHKKMVLYGLDSAREAIRREGSAVLVEGYFDQISLRIRGVENAVAPLGTAFGKEQARLLRRFTSNVVTLFDGDEAGLRAAKRAIPIFLAEGIEGGCVALKEDKDPDEAIRRIGPEEFRQLIAHAQPMIDFLLDSLHTQYDLTRLNGRNLALEECLPVLREIADSKERDYLIERFASGIRIREDRIRSILKTQSGRIAHPQERKDVSRQSLFDLPADERNIVRGMLLKEGFIHRATESGVLTRLREPILKEIARRLIQYREQIGSLDAAAFCSSLEDERMASMVASWIRPRIEEDDLQDDQGGDIVLEETLTRMRLRSLEERKSELEARIASLGPNQEDPELFQEYTALVRQLHKAAKFQ
ncbi:MAG: DNA primase [Thermodesulfobacteriota bacterium]